MRARIYQVKPATVIQSGKHYQEWTITEDEDYHLSVRLPLDENRVYIREHFHGDTDTIEIEHHEIDRMVNSLIDAMLELNNRKKEPF